MAVLQPPFKQYLLGKSPSHSTTLFLHDNFVGMTQENISSILSSFGYIKNNKPTQKALDDELVDICERKVLWNIHKCMNFFIKIGLNVKRKYANQTIPDIDPSTFVTLSVVATHFNVSAATIGKWIDSLHLRENGVPRKDLIKQGIVVESSFKDATTRKTRTFFKWNCLWLVEKLVQEGHPLDFDYMKSLEGRGKNSDVHISHMSDRIIEITEHFIHLYNSGNHKEARRFVQQQPSSVIRQVEDKLHKHHGWISSGECFRKKYSSLL